MTASARQPMAPPAAAAARAAGTGAPQSSSWLRAPGAWTKGGATTSLWCCAPNRAAAGAETGDEVTIDVDAEVVLQRIDSSQEADDKKLAPAPYPRLLGVHPAEEKPVETNLGGGSNDELSTTTPSTNANSPATSSEELQAHETALRLTPMAEVEAAETANDAKASAVATKHIIFERTGSFEVDGGELPEIQVPDGEKPLISGHLEVPFADLVEAMFMEVGGPFDSFLEQGLGCFDIDASPWVRGETNGTQIQRSKYQLPLPADIPQIVATVLGLGKSVNSGTFSRIFKDEHRVILQQSSKTEGLLYSERMRVQNTHYFEADKATGGVAWRTWTRIVWTKALPWTHSFIGKIIDSRVKAETKLNAPKLMDQLALAAQLVASSSNREERS